jgi:hypothetical protein
MKPSALVDTRVVYCGDNLDQLRKLSDAEASSIAGSNHPYEHPGQRYRPRCVLRLRDGLVAAQNLGRQWIGIDHSPTACRVMAKRLRDVCKLPENEKLWQSGRGFIVRDLPWSVEKLRRIPPFEFENWAVIALGGNSEQVSGGRYGD